MLYEITSDHIIHICIMPEADDELDQSAFQGFIRGLLYPSRMQLISNTLLLPRHILELFLNNDQLTHFRNKNAVSSIFLLDISNVINVLPLIIHYPYVVISCLEFDLKHVKELQNMFTHEPILVCGESIYGSNEPVLGPFSLDILLNEKLKNQAKIHTEDPGLKELASKSLRDHAWKKLDFHYRNHGVTIPTETVLRSLGYDFANRKPPPNSAKKNAYISAMLEASTNLLSITGYDKGITKSDLIINTVSMYAFLYNFNGHFWNQLLREVKNTKIRNAIKNGIFKNPNYSGFSTEDHEMLRLDEHPFAKSILNERQSELALNVIALELLAVSINASAIRLPNSMNFYAGRLKELETLSKYEGQNRIKTFKNKFMALTGSMMNDVGEEIRQHVVDNSKSVVICSDAPIEWLTFDRVPFMFTHELSRIPTTPGNLFMAQCTQPLISTFDKSELLRVTLIRSFEDTDPIKLTLEHSLKHFINIDNRVDLNIIDVNSEAQFLDALRQCPTKIIIFDCHGDHDGVDGHGWLMIGEDKVDIWNVGLPLPPIVILSACLTTAIAGSHASVANGFLKNGAISVLSTFLPVDANDSAVFVGRIVYRISAFLAALESIGRTHITWRELISGFLRMSYCMDLLRNFCQEKLITEAHLAELQMEANMAINYTPLDWLDKFLENTSQAMKIDAQELEQLIREQSITETMNYLQIGRPENIVIELMK